MKKIYYAHSMHLYNTPQEKRDIEALENLGFEVLNPNNEKIQEDIEKLKKEGNAEYMLYFDDLIASCDAFAYRCHVDGKIPSGVGYEIKFAAVNKKPIIELPSLPKSRFLDVDDTRLYLQLNGQR